MYDDPHAYHIPRRPFSPEVALTSSFSHTPIGGTGHIRQREPSDESVEALDLVDYAANLRFSTAQYDPYATVSRMAVPPSSQMRASSIPSVPPLSYSGSTSGPSTSTNTTTLDSATIARYVENRPYAHQHFPPAGFPAPAIYPTTHDNGIDNGRFELSGLEDDPEVERFPSWSRRWFKEHRHRHQHPHQHHIKGKRSLAALPELDLADPYDALYDRDLLPWSRNASSSQPTTPATKEERIRMLEREFGGDRQPWLRGNGNGRVESDDKIGSVDESGHLITGGKKKRITLRVFQVLLVLAAGATSIYATLFIKLANPKEPPPPSHRIATYALYILSVVSFLLLLWLYAIQPCCCSGTREGKDDPYTSAQGMMMFPAQAPQGKKKGGKKGKKGQVSAPEVNVNLMIDPRMFEGRGREDEYDMPGYLSEDEEEGSMKTRGRGHRQRRRGVFAGFALEAAWKRARAQLKKHLVVDGVFMVLWAVEFVAILIGPRCSSGTFNGWCDAFNIATASSCFLVLCFALSVYFGVKDLHASKVSPRQRT